MLGYNQTFHVNFDTSADKFQNYYKDLSQRVKAREVDLLIVVNMFLTGFDATTLNTLWVDKNLKMHGLIQAFSRTNRILNSVKTYGNIVCFRNLQKATDDAIALFGDREASGVVLLKGYDAHYDGYEENGKAVPGYRDLIDELSSEFPLGQPITGEQKQKDFIKLYGNILRLKNILRPHAHRRQSNNNDRPLHTGWGTGHRERDKGLCHIGLPLSHTVPQFPGSSHHI